MATSLTLTCWGKYIRSSQINAPDAYFCWPSVKLYPDGSLDLEYGPLLLVDNLIIDQDAYEFLIRTPPTGLETACQSLQVLEREGYLLLRDYNQLLEARRDVVVNATEVKIAGSERFLQKLQESITTWETLSPKFSNAINRQNELEATLPIGIIHALCADGKPINLANAKKLRRIVFKNKPLTTGERDTLTEIARPYFDHAHTTLALSKALNSPVFDWDDLRPIYSAVLFSHLDSDDVVEKRIPKARELFSVSLPAWEPSNVHEFLAVIRDSRVSKFREFIVAACEGTVSFDDKLSDRLLREIVAAKKVFSLASTGGNTFATLFGVAASVWDGGLTTAASLALGASTYLAQEGGMRLVDDLIHRDTGWFLCLVSNKAKQGVL